MFNYEKTIKTVDAIINTIDFSKAKYSSRDSINFNELNLTDIPSADFGEVDSIINRIESSVDGWATAIQKSRMGENKKALGQQRIDYIKANIDFYKNIETVGDTEDKQYQKAYDIKNRVIDLADYMPSSEKENVKHVGKLLEICVRKISSTVGDRSFILRHVAEKLVNQSEEFRINAHLERINQNGLTVKDIQEAPSEDFLCAARMFACNKFGRGAGDLISSIFYAKKLENSIPEITWVFNSEVENIVNFAKYLELKEFAFKGDSTAALADLNTIVKLGLKFRIEEITRNEMYDEQITSPVAIVTL